MSPQRHSVQVSILHVPDCPLVGRLQSDVETTAQRLGVHTRIERIEGDYPSPTLLVDAAALEGYPLTADPACRIDVPTGEQIAAAIRAAAQD